MKEGTTATARPSTDLEHKQDLSLFLALTAPIFAIGIIVLVVVLLRSAA